jgi:hypothetical protein
MNNKTQTSKNLAEARDLSDELSRYRDKWVAISNETSKVVSSGDSPSEVIKEAGRKGEQNPVLTKVPKEYGNFVL